MPPDPPREQGPEGLATPSQINATPTSKTVENPAQGKASQGIYFSSRPDNKISNNFIQRVCAQVTCISLHTLKKLRS